MKKAVLFMLRCYKAAFSPLFGNHCRFHPSCSTYTYQAVEKYGAAKGIYLGTRRLLKCHPFHPGGVDPVP